MKQGWLWFILFTVWLGYTDLAACECCADRLTTHGGSFGTELLPMELKTLESLQLSGRLALHSSERDPVIPVPSISMKGFVKSDTLFFIGYSGKKQVGSAFVLLPLQIQEFHTDLRLIYPAAASKKKTTLYKEARFNGKLEINAKLRRHLGLQMGEAVRLVLHGVGDKCWKIEQFHSWTMQYDYQHDGVELVGFGYGMINRVTKKQLTSRKSSALPNLSAGAVETNPKSTPITAAKKVKKQQEAVPIQAVAMRGSKFHIVEAGQTVYRIALIHGLNVDDLARWNNISPPNYIVKIGQKILLQPPSDLQK
ncbi:MAG: LysM peptidoglycan-binding domain-containing protein [Calditrichia bacterium]